MFKTNTLRKYFFMEFSKNIIIITLLFLGLGIFLNLFEEINFFKDHDVGIWLPLSLCFLKVPNLIYKLFPFIFLISSIHLFLKLIQSEEIISIKVAGISNFKIIIFPAVLSFLFGIIIVTGINSITSKLTYKYLDIKNDYTRENDYLAALTENGIWIKDKVNKVSSIIRADGLSGKLLKNVTIYQYDENDKHYSRIESKEADISDYRWKLTDMYIYYTNNNKAINYEEYYFLSNLNINKIKGLFSNLDSISFWELNKLKKNYKYLGYSTKEIDGEFQRSLAFPLFLMSMTLLAGVVVMNVKYRGSTLAYIFISIFLSVLIYFLSDLSKALGETEQISLLLSVWTPLAVVLILSSIGMIYINEK